MSIWGGSGHRLYQKTVLFMTVVVTLLTLGGLWIALVQTQLVVGSIPADDGSGSADGALSDLAVLRQQVVVATFLAVEILVCALSNGFCKDRGGSTTDSATCCSDRLRLPMTSISSGVM